MLVTGCAGAGKSTAFVVYGPYRWAVDKAATACGSRRLFWSQFEFVIVLGIREEGFFQQQHMSKVLELGDDSFDLNELEQKEVVHYVRNNAEKVLIVSDGLDETKVRDSATSKAWKLLCSERDEAPGIHSVITSRAGQMALHIAKEKRVSKFIEVARFSEETINTFTKRVLADQAEDFNKAVCTKEALYPLLHNPLLANMICELFKAGDHLPKTMRNIFMCVTLKLLTQAVHKGNSLEAISDLGNLPEPNSTFRHLCYLAFDGLCKQKAVFSKDDLKQADCQHGEIELGFLLLSHKETYSFFHHNAQEFLAAVHAVVYNSMISSVLRKFRFHFHRVIGKEDCKFPCDSVCLTNILQKLGGYDAHLYTFFVFMSGLIQSDKKLETLFTFLIRTCPRFTEFDKQGVLFLCFYERRQHNHTSPALSKWLSCEFTFVNPGESLNMAADVHCLTNYGHCLSRICLSVGGGAALKAISNCKQLK